MNITIRLAIPSDAEDVAEVLMRSWEVAYKDIVPAEFIKERNALRPGQLRQRLTDDNDTYYIIQVDEKTIGYMRIVDASEDEDPERKISDLEQIYLHPNYYRQGIGTFAMNFAFDIARGTGKTRMTLWVLAENTAAINFYKKCGFDADGAKRTWEYGKPLEGIRMKRNI